MYKRLDSVRSELDEWVQREYSQEELPSEQFFNLYYRDIDFSFSRSISAEEQARHIVDLEIVQKILSANYPDSAPLRKLIKKLDAAIKSLEEWTNLNLAIQ